jgi:hypothetical protein
MLLQDACTTAVPIDGLKATAEMTRATICDDSNVLLIHICKAFTTSDGIVATKDRKEQ